MRVVGSIVEGPGVLCGGLGAIMGGLGPLFEGLGAIFGGLGARIGGSVVLLDANLAEKRNRSGKKGVRFPFTHPFFREKERQREPRGSQEGGQMEPKWE